MRTRQLLFQLHRYAGLTLTAFLLVAAATGCLLVFRDTLDAGLNPDLFATPGRGQALGSAVAAMRVEQAHPGWRIASIPVQTKAGQAIRLGVESRGGRPLGFDQAFVDPVDAHVVGVRAARPGWDRRHLMQGVYLFHYTLLAGTPGRWLMGGVAVGWSLINLIGVWLTLPAGGRILPRWGRAWTLTLSRGLQRALITIHRATGLWLFAGVMMLSLTSVAMNFYDEAMRPAMMAMSPAKPSPFDRPPSLGASRSPRLDFAEVERRAAVAGAKIDPRLRAAAVTLIPERGLYWVQMTRTGRLRFDGFGPVGLYFDGQDGRLTYVDRPGRDSAGARTLRALYPLHSGQVGGAATQWLVLALGLATVEMTLTGLIAWGRKQAARSRRM